MKRRLLGICAIIGVIFFEMTSAFARGWPPHKTPEPDTLILLGLGAAGAITAWRIKRGSKRK